MVRRILAFLVAIGILVLLGSLAHSLFVQHAWLNAAAQSGVVDDGLSFADRLSWIAHDLAGLQPLYTALTTIALLIGFLVAGLVTRFTAHRRAVFALAGASCIFTLFKILKLVLGTVGVFGARGLAGLAVQMLVGLTAAVVFAVLTEKRLTTNTTPSAAG